MTWIYQKIVQIKNKLYDLEKIKSVRVPACVVSIGNLTMGGTGKTPTTDFILNYLEQNYDQIAVVSRNYQAEEKEISQVDVSKPRAAQIWGDEPVMLKKRHPRVSVWTGPKKSQTAQWLSEKLPNTKWILMDDGFQHRKLIRNLDIVILDATEKISNYKLLPFGRMREGFENLSRVDVVILSKVNWAKPETIDFLKKQIPLEKPTFEFQFQIQKWMDLKTNQEVPIEILKAKKVFLVSAIAKPEVFAEMIQNQNLQVVGHKIFRDHHPYQQSEIDECIRLAQQKGAQCLVVTEKDAVKIETQFSVIYPVIGVECENAKGFYEILDHTFSSR